LTPLLELDDLCKSFGRVVVADHLSFSLEAGEALGIVGPNGAGKTSMLNLISGNLLPDSGRIRLDGHDVTVEPAHLRARRGLGRTHQIPRPFGGLTVFENVLLGASYAGAAREDGQDPTTASITALEWTGLTPRANALAGSLTLLDRKRLELARALATRPRLLLLDEIAGGLTEPEVDALIETMLALKAVGVAIIWIEHVVQELLSMVDRLIAMDYGRKLAEGEPREVMANPEVQAVYLGQELER
jgi:branched-chain amino acid transport system ATP-binding protein